MWEAINVDLPRDARRAASGRQRPPVAFRWVRERAALVTGLADATMSRDDGWQFLVLGRSLERADMTARLVATAALSRGPRAAAGRTTLRACGAYEAFLRTYRGAVETERGAAEFLLLDRLFPRSVVHALTEAEECLETLEPPAAGRRPDEAQRLLGRARAELEYARCADLLDDLPGEMERVQRPAPRRATRSPRRYFAGTDGAAWPGSAAR